MADIDCKCSFCGKSQRDAKKLIASPSGESFICDECVDICKEIITEISPKTKFQKIALPTPTEIKERLDEYIIA